jgi:hypothetical protein
MQTKHTSTNRPKIRLAPWLLLFCLVGFGLRLQHLDLQPLWGDEGWSFYFAMQPLPALLELTAIDIHPPLYYLLLKGWLWVIGIGPAEGRLLSVLIGTALIPAVAILGVRLVERRVGLLAGAVVAGAPLAVYYAQEVRMYGLVTLWGVLSIYFFSRLAERRRTLYIYYILATVAALYTAYYAVFILLAQGCYTLIYRVPQTLTPGPSPRGRGEATSFTIHHSPFIIHHWTSVALLYLPWVLYAGPRLLVYIHNKRAVEAYPALNFIRFAGDHLVAFSLGHSLEDYVWAALPFVGLAMIGCLAAWRRLPLLLLYLFAPMLAGYGVNRVFPFNPAYYERALLLAAPAFWLLIAAGLIWLWDWQYLLVGTAALTMALAAAVSLTAFYTTPRYAAEDYRPLLRQVAARAAPEDTLLASYQWQLGFYYAYLPPPRPHLFTVPGWGQGWSGDNSRLSRDLAEIFATSPRLWFPAHQALGHQWEDAAEAEIATQGYPALLEWYGPQTKLTLAGAPLEPLRSAPAANFDNFLTLQEAPVGGERYQAGRGVVPVELLWQKEKSLGSEHRVSLRLADAAGRTWATRDSYPRAGQSFFTDLPPGETLTDRHGLLIPAGTPPGSYRLLLSVRRASDAHPLDLLDVGGQPAGAELLLAEVAVIDPEPPVGPAALPIQHPVRADFGDARLLGYSLESGTTAKAGETLPLTLFWQALADGPGPASVAVQLVDAGGQVALAYEKPPIRVDWPAGMLLRDPHDILLPPALPPGQYRLLAGVRGAALLPLATITTVDRERTYQAPHPQIIIAANFGGQAKLAGLDLPQTTATIGATLPLTLHWRAEATFDKSWKVFVHLVDDAGKIVAQQDQIPGGGKFPTTGWLPGEYLADPYALPIPPDTPPGTYHLQIGLYDPNDFSRLPVLQGTTTAGDHIALEAWPIAVQ